MVHSKKTYRVHQLFLFSVFESDDEEICEVLEDESEDDLHVFDDSEGSDWDSGSTRNPRAQ